MSKCCSLSNQNFIVEIAKSLGQNSMKHITLSSPASKSSLIYGFGYRKSLNLKTAGNSKGLQRISYVFVCDANQLLNFVFFFSLASHISPSNYLFNPLFIKRGKLLRNYTFNGINIHETFVKVFTHLHLNSNNGLKHSERETFNKSCYIFFENLSHNIR